MVHEKINAIIHTVHQLVGSCWRHEKYMKNQLNYLIMSMLHKKVTPERQTICTSEHEEHFQHEEIQQEMKPLKMGKLLE